MKEYVSKKDLPLIEIGTKFIYNEDEKLYEEVILWNQQYPTYVFTEEEMEELVKQGWVKEVEKSNPNPTPIDNRTFTLKSELPFARVGDPVKRRYNNELGVWFWYVHNRNSDIDWILGCDLLIDKDKWIQEDKKKPREFQLGIVDNGECAFAKPINENSWDLYNYDAKLPGVKEIIKVQEIPK